MVRASVLANLHMRKQHIQNTEFKKYGKVGAVPLDMEPERQTITDVPWDFGLEIDFSVGKMSDTCCLPLAVSSERERQDPVPRGLLLLC